MPFFRLTASQRRLPVKQSPFEPSLNGNLRRRARYERRLDAIGIGARLPGTPPTPPSKRLRYVEQRIAVYAGVSRERRGGGRWI